MSKLWRYRGYDTETRRMKEGFEYKTPEFFQEEQPDEEYENITTDEILIDIVSRGWTPREVAGNKYLQIMNSRLLILKESLGNGALADVVASFIDELFEQLETKFSLGQFHSVRRKLELVKPNEEFQQVLDLYSIPVYQQELIDEIKEDVQKYINELY